MGVPAASQGRGGEQNAHRHSCCRHSTVNSGLVFPFFFFVFSYPTLCLQPAQPDELSCLGHLDRTIRITSSTTTPPPLPTYQQQRGIRSFQRANTTWVFHSPKPLQRRCCSAASLAQGTCSIWHVSPAPAPAPHVLSSVSSRWDSCRRAQTQKERVSKQARELCSSV